MRYSTSKKNRDEVGELLQESILRFSASASGKQGKKIIKRLEELLERSKTADLETLRRIVTETNFLVFRLLQRSRTP